MALSVRAFRGENFSYVLEVSSCKTEQRLDLDVCMAIDPRVAFESYAQETIDCLGVDDTLTLFVLGGTNAKVLPRTSMDDRGKAVANAVIGSIEPSEYVHLWDGLHACLRETEIDRPQIPGRMSVVLLVTDGRRTACPLEGEREALRKYLFAPTRNPCKFVVAAVGPYAEARLLYDLTNVHDRFGNEFVDTYDGLREVFTRTRKTCARNVRMDLLPRAIFDADEVNAEGFPRDHLFGHQDPSRTIVLGDVFCGLPRRVYVSCIVLDYMDVFLEYTDPMTGETQKAMGLAGPVKDDPEVVSKIEQKSRFFSSIARSSRVADQDVDFARLLLVDDDTDDIKDAMSTEDIWNRWGRTRILTFLKCVFWSI